MAARAEFDERSERLFTSLIRVVGKILEVSAILNLRFVPENKVCGALLWRQLVVVRESKQLDECVPVRLVIFLEHRFSDQDAIVGHGIYPAVQGGPILLPRKCCMHASKTSACYAPARSPSLGHSQP